jgi:putative phosphoribosyl transferase
VVVAVPVGAASTVEELESKADEVICVEVPPSFFAVGEWYVHFDETPDEEVRQLLSIKGAAAAPSDRELVSIPSGVTTLEGELLVPTGASALVLFAHDSGSSRHSPRNQYVARVLRDTGFATLLLDLLTEEEDSQRELRFDIELLAGRLMDATDWTMAQSFARGLDIGYFGASTGAAAALIAAAYRPDNVGAVVSRGGRPDLARSILPAVRSPTLLIVGADDPEVLAMNREVLAELRCEKRFDVVPGASHLFEEPGTLERVAELACGWFDDHLGMHALGRRTPARRNPPLVNPSRAR